MTEIRRERERDRESDRLVIGSDGEIDVVRGKSVTYGPADR